MIILLIKGTEYFRGKTFIVLRFGKSSQRMGFTKQRTVQLLACHHFHACAIDQKTLLVHIEHHFHFLFRESRMQQYIRHQSHGLRKIFVQGV